MTKIYDLDIRTIIESVTNKNQCTPQVYHRGLTPNKYQTT